jgi:hypothetical protein
MAGNKWSDPLLEKIEPTPSGVKLQHLTLYVYADGHGNLSLPGKDSRGLNISVPADDTAGIVEAVARVVGEMHRQAQIAARLKAKQLKIMQEGMAKAQAKT